MKRIVVETDDLIVSRAMHIELNAGETFVENPLESGHGVFRTCSASSTMSNEAHWRPGMSGGGLVVGTPAVLFT